MCSERAPALGSCRTWTPRPGRTWAEERNTTHQPWRWQDVDRLPAVGARPGRAARAGHRRLRRADLTTLATGGAPPGGPGGGSRPGSGGSGAGSGAGTGTGPPSRPRVDRLIYTIAAAAVAIIGLASVISGLYPYAWIDASTGPLAVGGLAVVYGASTLLISRALDRAVVARGWDTTAPVAVSPGPAAGTREASAAGPHHIGRAAR